MAVVAAIAAGGAQAVKAYRTSKAHEEQAENFREAKNRRMGAATREMAEERRKQAFIKSRALAVSAASGAGTDAGMVKLMGDLSAEGEYRVMSVLWQGQNDAEGLLAQAEASDQAAKDAITMGVVNTVTSAFSAYSGAGGSFGGSGQMASIPSAGGSSVGTGSPQSINGVR